MQNLALALFIAGLVISIIQLARTRLQDPDAWAAGAVSLGLILLRLA
jgi:hypothetical protein